MTFCRMPLVIARAHFNIAPKAAAIYKLLIATAYKTRRAGHNNKRKLGNL